MSEIYLEILDKERHKVFNMLSHFKNYGYLAGGTALALQIKHRKSVDFDVFVNKPITDTLKDKVTKIFGEVNFYVNTTPPTICFLSTKLSKRKFKGEFNSVLFLEQLTYFKDLIETPMEFIKDAYHLSEIKSFLEKEVRIYLKKVLK